MKLATVCNDVRIAETARAREREGERRIRENDQIIMGWVYKFTAGTCVEIKNTGQN